MDTMQVIDEAGTIERDSQLEETLSGKVTEGGDTEATQKTKPVNSYIESWAAHFGSSEDRKRGRREICFDEGLGDIAEQVSDVVEAFGVIAEIMVTEAWRGNIANGFCLLASLIADAASQSIRSLDTELKIAERENRKLREELE